MADKRIEDFAQLAEANDDDLLLVSSESETYTIKVGTLKKAVQGAAEAAAASAAAAEAAAKQAKEDAADAVAKSDQAAVDAENAKKAAGKSASSASSAAESAASAANSAAASQQAFENATDALATVEEFAAEAQNIKTDLENKIDDAYVEGGYLYMTSGGTVKVGPLGPFSGDGTGSGSSAGSTIRIINGLPSRTFTAKSGDNVGIKYSWSSVDSEDGSSLGDGTAIWLVNNTKVATRTVSQGENSFDVTKYLVPGSANTIKLTIEDAYGNSKSFIWTVTITTYSMTWNLDTFGIHGSTMLSVRLTPSGDGTKMVYVTCDGNQVIAKEISSLVTSVAATVPAQSHGAHVIEAWMEVDGEVVEKDKLRHVGIWTEAGNTTPIIAVYNSEIEIAQFTTESISYMVYDPANTTTDIKLVEGYTTVSTLNVDRSVQTWAYRATTAGTVSLSIWCGDDVSANITVTAASIGYDIAPVTEGLVLDIDPTGHSNSETNAAEFGYVDGDGINHPFTFSDNFDWINGGFQQDDKGVTAFVVRRGTYVAADRSLFDDNAKSIGKNIKLIFKTEMVRDPNTEIMSCVSGGVGLVLQAEQATLSSALKSVTTPYCTNSKIEMDVNIQPESDDRFACVYLKASPSRGLEYDSTDRWAQTTPEMLKIGSEEADVWIYRLKMYDYALNRREILQNFVADCADPEEMVGRYERNDIFNSDGSINMTSLANRNPKLRVFHIKGANMTTGTDNEVVVDVEMWYTEGGEEHHFVATGVVMKAQGTSSLEYIAAALNLDLDFSECTSWVNGLGEEISSYAFTENSIGVDYFNLNADVASCEKANNVLNVDRYNRFNPFVFKGKAEDSRVRDTIEGHPCAVFFTNTSATTISVGDRTLAAGATMLYFAGNMNNSKKNFAVFGQDNTTYPEQCCVEIMNNNAAECLFKKEIGDDETWKDGNFKFRFPKNPTDAMKARFRELHSWVVSTDTTAATDEELASSVSYGEVDSLGNEIIYYVDSVAYRKAKFIHEVANYFHTDNVDFHYLYTEFTCGVDNRAKNCFVSYEPDEKGVWRWSFRTHYDHDTAYGNDNSGGLTFEYGLEDIDKVGDADVFNASDSVLWCNVRDLRFDELCDMFVDKDNQGCWDADDILAEFNEYQAARPEALEMEDAHNKYRIPSAARYRSMMLGTKEYQRGVFIPKQAVYMSSKYRGNLCTKNKITLRTNVSEGSTAQGNINGVVPFIKMYLRCQFGNLGEYVVRAVVPGQEYTLYCPEGSVLNDLETYIFTSLYISAIGSLAHLRPKFVDVSNAPLLRRAEFGSGDTGYSNTTMNTDNTGGVSFSNNPFLEYIDLRRIPKLAQSLDLSLLTSLEEIYTTDSGITGIVFAKGAPVRVAALNNLRQLRAQGLTKLESFTVGGADMTELLVEESPVIDTLSIIKNASNLERGRLPDVDWVDENADDTLALADLAGFDEFGEDSSKFVLAGKAYYGRVAETDIDDLRAKFPNLIVTYNSVVPTFTVTFQNYDGTVLHTQQIKQGGAARNPITAGLITAPARASTVDKNFSFIGWDTTFDIIVSDLVVTAVYSETVRTYTVRWWKDDSQTSMAYSASVEVYGTAVYEGEELSASNGDLWVGWDGSAENVTADIDLHAQWLTPTLPDAIATEYDFLYSDNPDDNSAYTLAEFYGICFAGKAKEYFAVGDEIKIVPNTTVFPDSDIIMQVYGFNHFKLADGSGNFAGVTFGMKGLMNNNRQMNSANTNEGGWASCNMRTFLNNSIFPALPIQWQAMIKSVQVMSSIGKTMADISTSVDKLFLFSHAELGWDTSAVPYTNEIDADAEKKVFDIFTNGGSKVKKTYNNTGTAGFWWLRSPDSGSSNTFRVVNNIGGANSSSAHNAYGVSFGFCI